MTRFSGAPEAHIQKQKNHKAALKHQKCQFATDSKLSTLISKHPTADVFIHTANNINNTCRSYFENGRCSNNRKCKRAHLEVTLAEVCPPLLNSSLARAINVKSSKSDDVLPSMRYTLGGSFKLSEGEAVSMVVVDKVIVFDSKKGFSLPVAVATMKISPPVPPNPPLPPLPPVEDAQQQQPLNTFTLLPTAVLVYLSEFIWPRPPSYIPKKYSGYHTQSPWRILNTLVRALLTSKSNLSILDNDLIPYIQNIRTSPIKKNCPLLPLETYKTALCLERNLNKLEQTIRLLDHGKDGRRNLHYYPELCKPHVEFKIGWGRPVSLFHAEDFEKNKMREKMREFTATAIINAVDASTLTTLKYVVSLRGDGKIVFFSPDTRIKSKQCSKLNITPRKKFFSAAHLAIIKASKFEHTKIQALKLGVSDKSQAVYCLSFLRSKDYVSGKVFLTRCSFDSLLCDEQPQNLFECDLLTMINSKIRKFTNPATNFDYKNLTYLLTSEIEDEWLIATRGDEIIVCVENVYATWDSEKNLPIHVTRADEIHLKFNPSVPHRYTIVSVSPCFKRCAPGHTENLTGIMLEDFIGEEEEEDSCWKAAEVAESLALTKESYKHAETLLNLQSLAKLSEKNRCGNRMLSIQLERQGFVWSNVITGNAAYAKNCNTTEFWLETERVPDSERWTKEEEYDFFGDEYDDETNCGDFDTEEILNDVLNQDVHDLNLWHGFGEKQRLIGIWRYRDHSHYGTARGTPEHISLEGPDCTVMMWCGQFFVYGNGGSGGENKAPKKFGVGERNQNEKKKKKGKMKRVGQGAHGRAGKGGG